MTASTLVCASCRKPVERTFDDDFQHTTTADGVACTTWPVVPLRAEREAVGDARWTDLRDHVRQERAAQDRLAAWVDQPERCQGRVEALDWVLATMDRMEAAQ